MSRISLSISINLILFAAVSVLGWLLYDRTKANEADIIVRSAALGPVSSPAPVDPDALSAISSRLTAIDTRLSAIERHTPAIPTSTTTPTPVSITPQAAAIADRRLNAMFPDGRVDQEDMQRFHIALASLPADEHIAITASMTQAINAGRIKLEK